LKGGNNMVEVKGVIVVVGWALEENVYPDDVDFLIGDFNKYCELYWQAE
jgi:hypothetical protein